MLDIPIVQAHSDCRADHAAPASPDALDSVVNRRGVVAPQRRAPYTSPRKKTRKIGKLWRLSNEIQEDGKWLWALLALMLFSRVLAAQQTPGSESRLELLTFQSAPALPVRSPACK